MSKLILTNVKVLDGEHPLATERAVVMQDDRIIDVVKAGDVAAQTNPGDSLLDLGGRTLMPGMGTCHFHSTYHDLGSTQAPYGSEYPPAYQALLSHQNLLKALRAGFTMVVSAGAGQDVEPGVRQAIEAGLVDGPRFTAGGREMSTTAHANDGVPWYWGMPASGAVRICNGADEFRFAVREQVKRGSQVIKLFVTGGHGVAAPKARIEMTRDELAAAIETAHERGVLIRGHLANKKAILWAIELGIDIIDHGDDLDDEIIAACVERGTFVVPSIYFPKVYSKIFPDNQAALDHMYDVLPKADAAGVRLLLGDDYGATMFPHGSYGGELKSYVDDAGIAPLSLLRWATVHAAQLIGRSHELGRVAPGYLADLVVVDGDPSKDIAALADQAPVAVLKGGKVVAGSLPS